MPNYDYMCEACDETWEDFQMVSGRDKPCKKPCPHCKKKKVKRTLPTEFPQMGVDQTLTANKKTGGQWNELMNKVKDYTPERFHGKLDKSSSQSGKRWQQ
jgi:putative FmdB family regulatory protein|tara:strand:- start:3900 stop:4199 length:300 start_codon:yes stop_codon:yes gene_type:complete